MERKTPDFRTDRDQKLSNLMVIAMKKICAVENLFYEI
jgi:hypothetical protein